MVTLMHIFLLSGYTMVINGQYEGRPRLPNKCAAIFCAAIDCLNPITPPGGCCAVCPPTLPPHCAAVSCLRPDCLNPTTPPGGCCPVCPPTLQPHCAAVSCLRPECLNPTTPPGGCCPVCPVDKPGQCPRLTGPSICVSLCTGDSSCPGNQKCCSNGCGQRCMSPVSGGLFKELFRPAIRNCW